MNADNKDTEIRVRLSAEWLLRIGLAFSLLYPAISAIKDPISWIGFVPDWLRAISDEQNFLLAFSILEIILAVWLILDRKVRLPAIITALLILAVTVSNLGAIEIVFRDISLVFMALALAFLKKGEKK